MTPIPFEQHALLADSSSGFSMAQQERGSDDSNQLKVFTFNVWCVTCFQAGTNPRGLAIISKQRQARIKAIAEYLATTNFDIVCLQELWVFKDYKIVRDTVARAYPHSRFFHT